MSVLSMWVWKYIFISAYYYMYQCQVEFKVSTLLSFRASFIRPDPSACLHSFISIKSWFSYEMHCICVIYIVCNVMHSNFRYCNIASVRDMWGVQGVQHVQGVRWLYLFVLSWAFLIKGPRGTRAPPRRIEWELLGKVLYLLGMELDIYFLCLPPVY